MLVLYAARVHSNIYNNNNNNIAHVYLQHWTLTSTTCNRSSEGRYDPISYF